MSGEAPNEALRAHVSRVRFDLSLAKSHVAALVYVDVMIRTSRAQGRGAYINSRHATDHARAFSHFTTGTRGLIERGLIEHSYQGPHKPFHRHYRITRAGRLVIGLLREAGMWAEYEAALPAPIQLRVAS